MIHDVALGSNRLVDALLLDVPRQGRRAGVVEAVHGLSGVARHLPVLVTDTQWWDVTHMICRQDAKNDLFTQQLRLLKLKSWLWLDGNALVEVLGYRDYCFAVVDSICSGEWLLKSLWLPGHCSKDI